MITTRHRPTPGRVPTGDDAAERAAARIAELPYVLETLKLPDFHLKSGMEAPASFVVACRDVIVPHLVSESINDGMGLVRTNLHIDDVGPDRLVDVLRAVNRAGAPTKLRPGPYSWTPELVEAACRGGAAPLLAHYGLDPCAIDAVEDGGCAAGGPLTGEQYRRIVPRFLRHSRVARNETGLNFGGNHFLELQVVDRIVDGAQARRLGIHSGQILVMYHLGPGPLGSILSNLHAYRLKPPWHRKVGYGVARSLLHAGKGRDRYRTFANFRSWNPVPTGSDVGRTLAMTLAVIKNYGFAYRMATVRAITDAVAEATGQDPTATGLVTDTSHNILQPESFGSEQVWVSRANCCRPAEGRPGIVAGSNQVGSCLTIGAPGCEDLLAGFDHGIGYLLERARAEGTLGEDPRGARTVRLRMIRGTDVIDRFEHLPVLRTRLMDDTVETLSGAGFVEAVAHLRPVANLKHKVPR